MVWSCSRRLVSVLFMDVFFSFFQRSLEVFLLFILIPMYISFQALALFLIILSIHIFSTYSLADFWFWSGLVGILQLFVLDGDIDIFTKL